MRNLKQISSCLFLALAILACGGGEQAADDNSNANEQNTEPSGNDDLASGAANRGLQEGMKALEETMKELNGGKEVEAVDFRDLQAVIPEKMQGMERTDYEGQNTATMGIKVSMATATFEDQNGGRVEFTLTDVAGVSMLTSGIATWTMMDIDKETSSGYERTTKIQGHTGYEKYDRERREGELALLVDERFIVTIDGSDIDEDVLRRAMEKVDLNKLAKLQ